MPTATVTLYQAAPGAGFNDRQAQRFGAFLEAKVGLGERPVAPEEIVEAARPKRSPIHGAFTWDDREAAQHWRLSEARHLVSHLVVSVPFDDGTDAWVRAFHNVTARDGDGARGYVSEEVVWRTPEFAEQVMDKALAELQGWTERYRTYAQLGHLVARVDEILEENGSE